MIHNGNLNTLNPPTLNPPQPQDETETQRRAEQEALERDAERDRQYRIRAGAARPEDLNVVVEGNLVFDRGGNPLGVMVGRTGDKVHYITHGDLALQQQMYGVSEENKHSNGRLRSKPHHLAPIVNQIRNAGKTVKIGESTVSPTGCLLG